MANTQEVKSKVITPEAVASYPTLAEPKLDQKNKLKYSIALVFLPGTDITEMKKTALAVLKQKYPTLAKTKSGGFVADVGGKKIALKWPFREDAEMKGYPEGSTFVNVRTERKPGVVDGQLNTIDPLRVYPGAIVKASLNAYCYDVEGSRGVTFGLNNVQFIRDGERLDSVVAAADEFEAVEVEDLSDLEDADDAEDVLEDEEPEEKPAPKKAKGKKAKPAPEPAEEQDVLDELLD